MKRSTAIATAAAVVVVAGGAATVSGAFAGSPSVPPAKPLATAVHDALTAPAVKGITARVTFTNKLIDSSSLVGGNPLLTGAKGRLWLADDGRARLELQSDNGDAQITSDGKTVTVYDATSNSAWVATLPPEPAGAKADPESPPSIARIKQALARLAKGVDLSGPAGTNVAGHEAYSVRFAPKHDGGLIGAGELAWDAATGVPLRAGVYAAGSSEPVLELGATDIAYGPVEAAALRATVPPGAKVTRMDLADHQDGQEDKTPAVTGAVAVAKALPFSLAAPKTLVGLPRHQVRLVDLNDAKGALVTYGAHLGGIVVLEQPVDAAAAKPEPKPKPKDGEGSGLTLPTVSIGDAEGQELATALGTVVRFQRGGVQYTVIGSVPPAAAEAAAREL